MLSQLPVSREDEEKADAWWIFHTEISWSRWIGVTLTCGSITPSACLLARTWRLTCLGREGGHHAQMKPSNWTAAEEPRNPHCWADNAHYGWPKMHGQATSSVVDALAHVHQKKHVLIQYGDSGLERESKISRRIGRHSSGLP